MKKIHIWVVEKYTGLRTEVQNFLKHYSSCVVDIVTYADKLFHI